MKAPVSQASVPATHLQAPFIPSPYSANVSGGLLCDRTCVTKAGDAAGRHHTVVVLSKFPAWYRSVFVTLPWISRAIRFPFKSTWAEHVADLSWGSRPGPSNATEQKTVRSIVAEMAFDTKAYFFCFLGKQLDYTCGQLLLWRDVALWLNSGQWKADKRVKFLL